MLERSLAGRFAQLTNRALPRFLSAALDLLLSPLYITSTTSTTSYYRISTSSPPTTSISQQLLLPTDNTTTTALEPSAPQSQPLPLTNDLPRSPIPPTTTLPPPPLPRLTPQPNLHFLYPSLRNPYSRSCSHNTTSTPSSSGTLHPALSRSAPALPRRAR